MIAEAQKTWKKRRRRALKKGRSGRRSGRRCSERREGRTNLPTRLLETEVRLKGRNFGVFSLETEMPNALAEAPFLRTRTSIVALGDGKESQIDKLRGAAAAAADCLLHDQEARAF